MNIRTFIIYTLLHLVNNLYTKKVRKRNGEIKSTLVITKMLFPLKPILNNLQAAVSPAGWTDCEFPYFEVS